MAKIIACYKWVTDEADIRINSEGSIDFSKAKGKISDYDKNAIEAAMQAAQSIGSIAAGNAACVVTDQSAQPQIIAQTVLENAER